MVDFRFFTALHTIAGERRLPTPEWRTRFHQVGSGKLAAPLQLNQFLCMVFHWEFVAQGVDIQALMQGPEVWGRQEPEGCLS